MKYATLIGLAILCASGLSGCGVAAIVAAASYSSSVTAEDRKAFHEHNLEREKAGLPPLTAEEWKQRNAPAKTGDAVTKDESGMGS